MRAYLARLPDGLASYPHCRARASLFLSLTEPLGRTPDTEGWPAELASLVRVPPPAVAWLPEVHFASAMRAIRDTCFESDEAFLAFSLDSQRRLFAHPIYRVVMAVVSPDIALRGARARWSHFHEGTELFLVSSRPGAAELRLHAPAHLGDRLDHLAALTGMRAALELAGGRSIHAEVREESDMDATFELAWEEG